MKYFTKELYQDYQVVEGMTPDEEKRYLDEKERLWDFAVQEYKTHVNTINDALPESVRQLLDYGFHDSMITAVVRNEDDSLRLELDTRHVPWIEGSRYWLTFSHSTFFGGAYMVEGSYWLYDEIHLSKHSAFELHVLCQSPKLHISEFRIAADDLQIERVDC